MDSSQIQAAAEKDDDLAEGDFESDSEENPNDFKIRDPLNPPSAQIFSTQQLHSKRD